MFHVIHTSVIILQIYLFFGTDRDIKHLHSLLIFIMREGKERLGV